MSLNNFQQSKQRRNFLEKELKVKFPQIAKAHIEEEENIYCENLIGETTTPLGVAGPIKIQSLQGSLKQKKDLIRQSFIPLATTEGALVASVNRGCKAINLSGVAKVFVKKTGTTRGPVYDTENLEKGLWFIDWLKKNEQEIKKEAEKTSSHLRYLKFYAKVVGGYTFIRFYFDCDEAMGMNMATIATEAINRWIEKKAKIRCLSITGNFCVDKKASWLNFLLGRGQELWAEVSLKKEIINRVLKTSGEKMFEVWLGKNLIGSILSGSISYNGHFANIVAAYFLATGQDLAHVIEGSLGITTTKLLPNGDLYFAIYLPAVMLAMVGGGTKLKIKKEAIAITQAKNSRELAEVLGAAVLAGEISLLASLAEGSLARAHQKLGR
ncbi:MAG: hydroxymethylglutaryl-CoA reductase [Microgenomates group bacterium]|nr:hydroxymethylglutaryl-CoA reductase [Microgenomates group bacterium]